MEELLQYLIDNYITIDNNGYLLFSGLPDLEREDDRYSLDDYHRAEAIIQRSIIAKVKIYDGKLELSDRHTLYDIENIDGFADRVEEAKNKFREETGEVLYLLGKNFRHVCVDFSAHNLMNFKYLRSVQQRLEQEVIESSRLE